MSLGIWGNAADERVRQPAQIRTRGTEADRQTQRRYLRWLRQFQAVVRSIHIDSLILT
jgi:hypothetical protein